MNLGRLLHPVMEPKTHQGSFSSASTWHLVENIIRSGLANHMRNMPHSEFLELIQNIYKSFLNAVQGLHSQGVAFLEVLESIRCAFLSADLKQFY
jgi:hypothetical protein